jgi:hypothetical protein
VTTNDKTTAIYVRTAVHGRTGDQSLAIQEQACRSYAAQRGWRVGEVFAVEGTPGTRPAQHPTLSCSAPRVPLRGWLACRTTPVISARRPHMIGRSE